MGVKNTYWAAAFLLILVLIIIFNGLFLVVFCKRRRLKQHGFFTLILALSLVDLFAGGLWTGLSAVATLMDSEFSPEVCRFQSFLLTFTQCLTAFTLATIALERLLRMLKPSRHNVVFVPKMTLFAVFALMVFCAVISTIHLYGIITTSWHTKEHQCGADFTENVRLLDMTFCFDYAIPYLVIALPAFIAAFISISIARCRPSRYGEIVLERNSFAPADSYSSRLSKLQSKFRAANTNIGGGSRNLKPTLGQRVYTSKGYTEPEHWDSDIDDGTGDNNNSNNKYMKKKKKTEDCRERIHALPRPEYSMLVMAAIVTLVTALLWFPWIVVRFVWNKTPNESVPEGVGVIAVACMHVAACIKPLVYLFTNPFFRSAVRKTFCGRSKKGLLITYSSGSHSSTHTTHSETGYENAALKTDA